ncbi:hypothetical protein ACJX0J_023781, partial [Zea mays]
MSDMEWTSTGQSPFSFFGIKIQEEIKQSLHIYHNYSDLDQTQAWTNVCLSLGDTINHFIYFFTVVYAVKGDVTGEKESGSCDFSTLTEIASTNLFMSHIFFIINIYFTIDLILKLRVFLLFKIE